MHCFMTGKICDSFDCINDDTIPLIEKLVECNIDWDDKRKQYNVLASFKNDIKILYDLILKVAENSRCSCGCTLVLSDHSIKALDQGNYIFAGVYKCPLCKEPRSTAVDAIKRFFENLQVEGKVFGVKVGYNGVTLKKE